MACHHSNGPRAPKFTNTATATATATAWGHTMTAVNLPIQRNDMTPCAACGKDIMICGTAVFYRMQVAQMALNFGAVQRHQTTKTLMGGSDALAEIIGRKEDIADPLRSRTICLCADCAMAGTLSVCALLDAGRDTTERTA